MFRAKTVLVLGAGASFEVGMPLGTDLLAQIADMVMFRFEFGNRVKGDEAIFQALRHAMNEGGETKKLNEHLEAAVQLAASARQARSIDAVIDALEDPMVELVGKMGIVRAILGAEHSSRFFATPRERPDDFDLKRFEPTWYARLSGLLFDGRKRSDVGQVFENLEVINFNYDRCLETYLWHSLAEFYGLSNPRAQEIVSSLVMHRPYGSVGKLPWFGGEGPHIPFGQGSSRDIALAAQQVRTFTERVDEGAELKAMRNAIAGAERLIFLGFGFHRQNVELVGEAVGPNCEVFGTGLGLSDDALGIIKDELIVALEMHNFDEHDRGVWLPRLECAPFFDEFSRRLSAEAAPLHDLAIERLNEVRSARAGGKRRAKL